MTYKGISECRAITLTTGLDNATANQFFASETYFNVDGKGPTLNAGDKLTGTAGRTDNTLTITDLTAGAANDNIPAGVTLTNIQNVILNSSGNTAGGTGFSTVGYADVRSLVGTTNGGAADVFTAKNGANGTSVNATHNGFAGNLTVVGGADVTATTTGGNIVIGSPAQGRVPLATEVATGAIVVNQNNAGGGTVGVFGGTTVTVNTTSTSNTGAINVGNTAVNTTNTLAGAIANASGDINVTTAGSGAVNVMGGANVTVVDNAPGGLQGGAGAGVITVGDRNYVAASNQATGNVTITETNAIAYNGLAGVANNQQVNGAINVFGGKNVTITTNGANNIIVGQGGVGAKVDQANPAGVVTITNTGVAKNVAGAQSAVSVTGGTDVSVTNTGGNVTIGRAANANIDQVSNPSGNVTVTETMNFAGSQTAVIVDGGQNVTVNAKGQNVVIGNSAKSAPTGAVVVNQADIFTGNTNAVLNGTNEGDVTVRGGTDVTINTTGGNVTVGGVIAGVNTVPSGAVSITRTFSGPGADTTSVQGGTTVNITTTKTSGAITVGNLSDALTVDGTALKDAVLAPTGDVTIVNKTGTSYGTSVTNVKTNGAATVSITGGDVDNVFDVQSTLATGGANAGKAVGTSTLASVVIDGLQDANGVAANVVNIQSDALTALSVLNNKGGNNTVNITNNTVGHSLAVTQGGNATGNNVTVVDANATALTVADNGTASTADLVLQAVKATSLTVNNAAAGSIDLLGDAALTTITLKGAGAVTLKSVETLGKVATIDASASSGAVTTSIAPVTTNGVAQKFTGGSGAATVTVGTNAKVWGDGVLLTGGTGSNDVIVANYASAVGDVALGSGTASVKGFEILGLGAAADSTVGSYDASGFSGVTLGAVTNNVVISNAAKNASLSITAAPTKTVTFNGAAAATAGSADALTINVNTGTTADGINANTVTANGYETISIVSNGATKTVANSMTLADTTSTGTGTLAISGTGKLTLNDATTFATKIDVTNSNTVDITGVAASNKGVAITGGTGALSAKGAVGGTELVLVSITGNTANAATVTATINGTTVTYTNGTGGTVDAVAAATGLAAAITAGAIAGVTATASGSNVLIQKAVAVGAAAMSVTTAGSSAATVNASLVGGTEEQVLAVTGAATGAVNYTFPDTSTAAIAAIGDSAATVATKLAAAITAQIAQFPGLVSAVAVGSNVVLTGGTGTKGVFAQIAGVGLTNGVTVTAGTQTINYATANDSFTSGSGGGTYDVGLGGSWSATTHKYSAGSETVNLAASTAKVDTIKLNDGRVVTNNGTAGGVSSFVTSSFSASDVLNFATAGKTALANVAVPASVSAATGAATMAAVLDPSGALLTALSNLTYTITNGVITFSATGGHSLSEFTTAQLISAAEILVNSSTTGGNNKVAAFSTGGNSYVVASDGVSTLATGTDAKDILVQLTGVSSTTGFGSTGASGTIVSDSVTNVTANALNTGSAALAVYDETGYAYDIIANAEFGTTSTSITNLAPSAKLTLGTNAAGTAEAINITQTGAAGQNSLTLDLQGQTFKSIVTNGDGLLVLTSTNANTINSLSDGATTATLSTIKVVGGTGALDVKAITDSALTAIDSSAALAAVTFGSTTAIAKDGVAFTLSAGQNSTITASGVGDTFTQAAGAGKVVLTASGASNVIDLGSTSVAAGAGASVITANGASDKITVGGAGDYTIVATGANDTFNVASGAGVATITVGSNATVNLGTANTANNGGEVIKVQAAVTGATADAAFAKTTISFATGVAATGTKIDFTNIAGGAGDTFTMLGDANQDGNATAAEVALSQVNVASATSLTEALNMAANYANLVTAQGNDLAASLLVATRAQVDWFQYGGDTYVVAMVNSTGAAAQQTGLDAGDIVVKLVGQHDLTGATFTGEQLILA